MSGLETVAAIIGITDASFRSILILYDTIRNLKHAPQDIGVLESELVALQHCLLQLEHLSTSDEKAIESIKDFRLGEIVRICGEACTAFCCTIRRWSTCTLGITWRARLLFIFSKKEIQSIRDHVNAAKQTAILAIVIAQLSIQLRQSSSETEKLWLLDQVEERIFDMSSTRNELVLSRSGRASQDSDRSPRSSSDVSESYPREQHHEQRYEWNPSHSNNQYRQQPYGKHHSPVYDRGQDWREQYNYRGHNPWATTLSGPGQRMVNSNHRNNSAYGGSEEPRHYSYSMPVPAGRNRSARNYHPATSQYPDSFNQQPGPAYHPSSAERTAANYVEGVRTNLGQDIEVGEINGSRNRAAHYSSERDVDVPVNNRYRGKGITGDDNEVGVVRLGRNS